MSNGYKQLFRHLPTQTAPAGLSLAVMNRIATYEVRRLRIKAAFHGIMVAVALILCIPAINYLAAGVAQSGFSEYLSLLTSDSGYVIAHFQDFALSLADSLPAAGAVAILVIGLVFVDSLRRMLVDLASLSAFRRKVA